MQKPLIEAKKFLQNIFNKNVQQKDMFCTNTPFRAAPGKRNANNKEVKKNYSHLKLTSIRKVSNFTVDKDHSEKVRKQQWLPTPANILMGI